MPDKIVALLVHLLEQNDGLLSNRAREKEFLALRAIEVEDIEKMYALIMNKK